MAESEAEKLKVKQEIAKAKARSRVFETSAVDGRWLKMEQYGTEAPSIIGRSKYGERTWDIDQSRHGERIWDITQSRHGERIWDITQSRHGERIWDIPQLRQERNMIGNEHEEIDRTVAAGQADITSILCNLLEQQSAPDVDLLKQMYQECSIEVTNVTGSPICCFNTTQSVVFWILLLGIVEPQLYSSFNVIGQWAVVSTFWLI